MGTVLVPHYLKQSYLSDILNAPNSLLQQIKQKSSGICFKYKITLHPRFILGFSKNLPSQYLFFSS